MKIDSYIGCISAFGEDTCGAVQQIIHTDSGTAAILVHGPGNGVRGNIPATFASRVFASMAGRGERFDDIVSAVASMLPKSSGNGGCAFAVTQTSVDGFFNIAQSGMPPFILLRRGRKAQTDISSVTLYGCTVQKASFALKPADTVIVYNTGAAAGWQHEELADYLASAYTPRITAQKLTSLLLNAAMWLSHKKPADDLCVLTLRACRRQAAIPAFAVREGGSDGLQNFDASNL